MNILTLFLGFATICIILSLIKIILNKLIFKNEEKSVLLAIANFSEIVGKTKN